MQKHNIIWAWVYWNGEGVITDEREAYIWLSIARVNGDEDATGVMRDTNWNEYLTAIEIKFARREATRRLEAIDRVKEAK